MNKTVCTRQPRLVPRPRIWREKWPGIRCLRMCEQFRKFSANKSEYGQVTTWLLCREITKLDNIRLAVWQLCLRGDCFSLSVVSILLRLAFYSGHVPSCQTLLGSQQLLVSYSAAVTNYRSADSTALRLPTWSTIRDKSREKEWLHYNHRQFHRHCDCSWKQTAESHSG